LNVKTLCGCHCEKKCEYENHESSCKGGNLKCGACQDCPEGSFGEFCQCNEDGTEREYMELKALPAVEIGKKDDLIGQSTKEFEDKISFDHVIAPIGLSPDTLVCSATYCVNKNTNCHTTSSSSKYDVLKHYNIFAIYGDHRLLPGTEISFKVNICGLVRRFGGGPRYETRFGFGTPPQRNNDYKLPTDHYNVYNMMRFWSDEIFYWKAEAGGLKFSKAMWGERENWRGEIEPMYSNHGYGDLGFVSWKMDSEINLEVTETEIVWSWEGFNSTENNLTEFRQKINTREKEYYPVFILNGCDEEEEFSSVEIIRSKVGKS